MSEGFMAKSSGGSSILTLALLGGAAYVAYQWWNASSAAAASSATPPAGTPPASPPPASPATSTAAGASTLDAQYQAMLASAKAAGFTSGNPDNWGFYYAQGNPGKTAPAPEDAGFNRTSNWPGALTAAQYWAAASPLIAKAQGLSGLGMLGGLGEYIAARGGW
jgi:hypothetical protein